MATDAGSDRSTALPSMVSHHRPSTWQTATGVPAGPAAATCRAFADVSDVITRASPASGSKVTPTGTTCGVPSARRVVSVARCRSRQKMSTRSSHRSRR